MAQAAIQPCQQRLFGLGATFGIDLPHSLYHSRAVDMAEGMQPAFGVGKTQHLRHFLMRLRRYAGFETAEMVFAQIIQFGNRQRLPRSLQHQLCRLHGARQGAAERGIEAVVFQLAAQTLRFRPARLGKRRIAPALHSTDNVEFSLSVAGEIDFQVHGVFLNQKWVTGV